MKSTLTLFSLMLVAISCAVQDEFKIIRTYKLGEADKYSMILNMDSAMGAMTVKVASTQTVKKVYENGDADIESAVTSLTINAMGTEMNPPTTAPTTSRFNKFGMQLTGKQESRGPMDFMRYINVLADKSLKSGETIPVDYKDPSDPKNSAKGTVKVESIADGVAKLLVNLAVTDARTGDKPMKLAMTNWVNVGNGKATRSEGTITDMPSMGESAPQIDKLTFTFTLEK